jgi:23S rRNA (guanosine2251-2'-O)-methyltransferase
VPVKVAYVAEGAERDDRLRDIFRFAADHAQPLLQITRAELDRLTGGAVHQGVALQVPPFAYADPQEVVDLALDQFDLAARAADDEAPLGPVIVACDHITDPHNLGAIIRSAAAFGAVGILLPQRRSAHVTAAVWKASAGAAAHLPVAQVTNLNQALVACAKAGFTVIGLAGDGDAVIAEAPTDEPIVLVVGAEDTGLSRLVREHCDVVARIPMSDTIESLNASVAVGVALYELRRF